ncbi:MAG: methyltransferase domain-containing protein, partial [Candidatus Omnitrophica bacterium]|nr:methyltransferase domain-containing protein [Candidatus Omnitrophota bacterium]
IKKLLAIRRGHNAALKYARGYMSSQCICALINIGFFDKLTKEKKIDLALYIKENNLDARIFNSICDYLYSINIIEKNKGICRLTAEGKVLLGLAKGFFDLIYAYAPLFQELESIIKKEKKYNKDIFRRGEFVARGSAGLTKFIPFPVTKNIIKKYGFKRVCDLGCGSAEFLISLCDDKKIRCYGIDISKDAIDFALLQVKKANLENRVELAVSDIFDIDRIAARWQDIEVITCMFVLHEFLLEEKKKVINFLLGLKSIFKNKYIITWELCRQPLETIKKNSSAIAEHHLFHDLSNQGIITIEEWAEIFKSAGYAIVEERYFDFAGLAYFVIK